jgi:hypothetical protein
LNQFIPFISHLFSSSTCRQQKSKTLENNKVLKEQV